MVVIDVCTISKASCRLRPLLRISIYNFLAFDLEDILYIKHCHTHQIRSQTEQKTPSQQTYTYPSNPLHSNPTLTKPPSPTHTHPP